MKRVEEQYRDDQFCEQISSAIWKETVDPDNPYLVSDAHCHGYSHLELVNRRSFADVLFLLFRGELPSAEQHQLFEHLLLSCIHPGPRHNACRAAMNAAVSKTHVSHVLPLALNVFSGEWQGSHEVYQSMKFLSQAVTSDTLPSSKLDSCPTDGKQNTEDHSIAPGFGSQYGDIDPYSRKLADNLLTLAACGPHLKWATAFSELLSARKEGFRLSGLAAAALLDLGFSPYEGELIFQIASAPGIAAQAAEKANAALTEMPFIPESRYVIEQN
jgi:citrate synthase